MNSIQTSPIHLQQTDNNSIDLSCSEQIFLVSTPTKNLLDIFNTNIPLQPETASAIELTNKQTDDPSTTVIPQSILEIISPSNQETKIKSLNILRELIEKRSHDELRIAIERLNDSKDYLLFDNGTTLLSKALESYDKETIEILHAAGIRHYFEFNMDEKNWEVAIAQMLGLSKARQLIRNDLPSVGSRPEFIYPMIHKMWSMFSNYVQVDKSEWIENALISESYLEEIGDAIIHAVAKSPQLLLERYRNGHPIIIETGDKEHSITYAIHGRFIAICNRGDPYKGQIDNFELYEFDTSKLTRSFIEKAQILSNSRYKVSNKLLYKKNKNKLNCKKAQEFGELLETYFSFSDQKNDNCTVASLKLAIFALLIMPHSKNISFELLCQMHKIYKSSTSFLRSAIEMEYIMREIKH